MPHVMTPGVAHPLNGAGGGPDSGRPWLPGYWDGIVSRLGTGVSE